MKNNLVTIAVTFAGLSLATFAQAQSSLEGAWQLQETMVSGGENAGTNANPNLHLIIFSEGHYSRILDFDDRPEVPAVGAVFGSEESAELDELRLATLASIRANAGTYEVSGSTLTLHFMLALNPGAVGNSPEFEYQIEGDKLMITATNNQDVVTRTTFTRLD